MLVPVFCLFVEGHVSLRHTEIIPVLELLKCSTPFRGVGRIPARSSPLAWFASVITVIFLTCVGCFLCCPSHVVKPSLLVACISPDYGDFNSPLSCCSIIGNTPPFLSVFTRGNIIIPPSPESASRTRTLMVFSKSSLISTNYPAHNGMTCPR